MMWFALSCTSAAQLNLPLCVMNFITLRPTRRNLFAQKMSHESTQEAAYPRKHRHVPPHIRATSWSLPSLYLVYNFILFIYRFITGTKLNFNTFYIILNIWSTTNLTVSFNCTLCYRTVVFLIFFINLPLPGKSQITHDGRFATD